MAIKGAMRWLSRSGGRRGRDSPFVPTPVAADTEVFVDRIRGIALVTAALSCGRGNKEKHIYSPAAAEYLTEEVTPPPLPTLACSCHNVFVPL